MAPQVVVAEPVSPPEVHVDPEDALVWIPHPICAWVPFAESGELVEQYLGDAPLEIRASGYLPAFVEGTDTSITLDPAPEQGALVVVAWPGDRVQIGEMVLTADPDGVVVATAPPGPVRVQSTGSGRSVTVSGYIGDGHALWLRIPDPEPEELLFAVNSAVVSPEALVVLQQWADTLEGGRLQIRGGSSSEGNHEANAALADRRAQAVFDVLIGMGVPAVQLTVLSSEVSLDPPGAAQRHVTLQPVGVSL